MSIKTFTKQPAETLDYDFDFTDWLSERTDTLLSSVILSDPGISVLSSTNFGSRVKVFLSGGLTGTKYKITCRMSTNGGRVKESEFFVAVKDT